MMVRRPWPLLALILPLYMAMATSLGFVDYHTRPDEYRDFGFTQYVPEVLTGRAEPPGRYRVLAPYVADWMARQTDLAPVTEWLIFRWFCLFAALLAGHVYLRTWFSEGQAVAGNAVVMALLPLTFTNSWPNPDQFTELALFTAACACIARGWWLGFLVALVLNAFNRETSAFLVLLYLLALPFSRDHVTRALAAGLIWLAITVGLRWQLGFVTYDPWQLWRNIGWLTPLPAGFAGYKRVFGWFFIVLLVPLFLAAARSWRDLPRFARATVSVVAPLYVVVACLFSSTIESRIFTPVLPLLAPAVLWTFSPPAERGSGAARHAVTL
jgi:hypothetical protein